MSNIRLRNIARFSVLYLGCLCIILLFTAIGLNDDWQIVAGFTYFMIIAILELKGFIIYFRGILIPGTYVFISSIGAHVAFNFTKDHSYLAIIGYLMIVNFVISCGYLIFVLHTFKPHHTDGVG